MGAARKCIEFFVGLLIVASAGFYLANLEYSGRDFVAHIAGFSSLDLSPPESSRRDVDKSIETLKKRIMETSPSCAAYDDPSSFVHGLGERASWCDGLSKDDPMYREAYVTKKQIEWIRSNVKRTVKGLTEKGFFTDEEAEKARALVKKPSSGPVRVFGWDDKPIYRWMLGALPTCALFDDPNSFVHRLHKRPRRCDGLSKDDPKYSETHTVSKDADWNIQFIRDVFDVWERGNTSPDDRERMKAQVKMASKILSELDPVSSPERKKIRRAQVKRTSKKLSKLKS